MGTVREIVFDCRHAAPLARFWEQLIDGYSIRAYDDAEIARLAALGLTPETDPSVMVDGPGPMLCFQEVPEGKVGKNRVHLDITAADMQSEIDRLCGLGASVLARTDGHAVMADPEGNEFCLTTRN